MNRPLTRNYESILSDPRWQRMRLKVMERDRWVCQKCGDHTQTLVVHHKNYYKGMRPWEHDPSDLETLCKPCHNKHHSKQL